ncbi:MAG: hypothetical protein KBS41_04880 [Oscillospiraceae bacterium]|nr:hypothetical protein [Candidatus Equicaccousia limihippi]
MREIISGACISVVGLSLIDMLLPDNKAAEIFINLIFVCCLLFPIAGGLAGEFDYTDITVKESGINTEYVEQNTARAIENTLAKKGITYKKVTVFSSILKDGGINISKAVIITDCDKQKVLDALSGAPFLIEVKNENE